MYILFWLKELYVSPAFLQVLISLFSYPLFLFPVLFFLLMFSDINLFVLYTSSWTYFYLSLYIYFDDVLNYLFSNKIFDKIGKYMNFLLYFFLIFFVLRENWGNLRFLRILRVFEGKLREFEGKLRNYIKFFIFTCEVLTFFLILQEISYLNDYYNEFWFLYSNRIFHKYIIPYLMGLYIYF